MVCKCFKGLQGRNRYQLLKQLLLKRNRKLNAQVTLKKKKNFLKKVQQSINLVYNLHPNTCTSIQALSLYGYTSKGVGECCKGLSPPPSKFEEIHDITQVNIKYPSLYNLTQSLDFLVYTHQIPAVFKNKVNYRKIPLKLVPNFRKDLLLRRFSITQKYHFYKNKVFN